MEKVLAPRVLNPPCARRMAWKMRTMHPRTLIAQGPNKTAPRPTPVGWEQLPVTDGIFKAERTKANAPASPSIILRDGLCLIVLWIDQSPTIKNGRVRANQNTHH